MAVWDLDYHKQFLITMLPVVVDHIRQYGHFEEYFIIGHSFYLSQLSFALLNYVKALTLERSCI